MLAAVISWSIHNRILVLIFTLIIGVTGSLTVQHLAVDAIPDLSDAQVIVRTNFPGQSPQVIEDQVTYPLSSALMSVPGAKTVRGYSFYGDSYIYIIFEDNTDIYWARSRVQEYLAQAEDKLPANVKPALGPDASGVGWINSYALVDRTGQHDLSELRSLQDWFLKYELQGVAGVSEIATVGGMVRQYQVVLDPEKLRGYGISLGTAIKAVKGANQEIGGSVVELGEAEYMIRTRGGYITSVEDIEEIGIKLSDDGIPVTLRDLASVQLGPEMRRAVADLNGEGEIAGGIVVMRYGENALKTIQAVKEKLESLKPGLPDGIEIIETYDRSTLILGAIDNLAEKLWQEILIVGLVCLIFLFHWRSAIVALVILPLGVIVALSIMHWQGINANIMSLGGIAIAIGTMVDAAIVMIENAHKHLEQAGYPTEIERRWEIILQASQEVGPALFYSLLIITLSFLPILALEGQEGRLFGPLALTKTWAMAAAAGFSVTLIPVLLGLLLRGQLPRESANPINRWLISAYKPLLQFLLRKPSVTILCCPLFSSLAW